MRPGVVTAAGYTYREQELRDARPENGTGTLGYTDPASKVIVVDPRLSPPQKASVIAAHPVVLPHMSTLPTPVKRRKVDVAGR